MNSTDKFMLKNKPTLNRFQQAILLAGAVAVLDGGMKDESLAWRAFGLVGGVLVIWVVLLCRDATQQCLLEQSASTTSQSTLIVKKECVESAITAIESGIEYVQEKLLEHDQQLGRATAKNKSRAKGMEADLNQMADALEGLIILSNEH